MSDAGINSTIRVLIEQLNKSPRGQIMLVKVIKFTEDEFLGCDSQNQQAILNLIRLAGAGYRGCILDTLEGDQK